MMHQALIAALAVGVLGAGVQTYRLAIAQRDLEAARAMHADYVAVQMAAQAEAQRNAREEEERRRREHDEIANEAAERIRQAQADAARAAAAAGKLRAHVAALAASCGAAPHTPAAAGSAPATGTGLLLADLFGRIDDRAGQLAQYADAAREAGRACERAYEALRRVP